MKTHGDQQQQADDIDRWRKVHDHMRAGARQGPHDDQGQQGIRQLVVDLGEALAGCRIQHQQAQQKDQPEEQHQPAVERILDLLPQAVNDLRRHRLLPSWDGGLGYGFNWSAIAAGTLPVR